MLKIYSCKLCKLFNTTKQHYILHCNTIKHINNNKIKNNIPIEYDENYSFNCDNCHKKYKSNKGLWQHKKKCIVITISNNNPITTVPITITTVPITITTVPITITTVPIIDNSILFDKIISTLSSINHILYTLNIIENTYNKYDFTHQENNKLPTVTSSITKCTNRNKIVVEKQYSGFSFENTYNIQPI
jgi:hypothetical protein